MTYAEKTEALGRELQNELLQPKTITRTIRYRTKIGGRRPGTVTIDKHGTFTYRPKHSRKIYECDIETVAITIMTRLAIAEAAKTRAARKHRTKEQ